MDDCLYTTLVMQNMQGEWAEIYPCVKLWDKSGSCLGYYHSLLESVLENQRSEY